MSERMNEIAFFLNFRVITNWLKAERACKAAIRESFFTLSATRECSRLFHK